MTTTGEYAAEEKRPTSARRRRIEEALHIDSQIGFSSSDVVTTGEDDIMFRKGSFSDELALKEWLLLHGVSTLSWGQGQARTVKSLFEELESGASMILQSQALRMTHVCLVKVGRPGGGKFLFETHEQLDNGTVRQRNSVIHPFSKSSNPILARYSSHFCTHCFAAHTLTSAGSCFPAAVAFQADAYVGDNRRGGRARGAE